MAQFCTCGSLMINDQCTNKNCAVKTAAKAAAPKKAAASKKTAEKAPKGTKTRRASKVVTYNLYDLEKREENVE